jgi:hypothetical protein
MSGSSTVIQNLRRWRALPGYSVERRIDVLLTPHLAELPLYPNECALGAGHGEFPLSKPHNSNLQINVQIGGVPGRP